jgi:hypothetical protein
MKKYLLPAKREVSGGDEAASCSKTPSNSVAVSSSNKRTSRANAAAANVAPVVIKIESDSSSDSAFETDPPRVMEPKQNAKQKKLSAKKEEPLVEPHELNPLSSDPYPAFPADIEDAQGSLLAWCASAAREAPWLGLMRLCRYSANKRDLPWRRQSGQHAAYGVWVSEVMLQQTRVATVVEYWNRWMIKWPSLHQLAASNIDDVNAMWSGLGYYRRARMLLEVRR